MNFTTVIVRQLDHPPLSHLAAAAEGEELEDEIELEVEVEYNPGYYTPAKLSGHPDSWAPAEGEDPEITSVIVIETGEEILPSLTDREYEGLVEEAWGDQGSDNYY